MPSTYTRISAHTEKTRTRYTMVQVITTKPIYSEAVYMVNRYLMQDNELKTLMGGEFVIEPLVALGTGDRPLVPYIRYASIPAMGPIWATRTDMVRYYVGHRTYAEAGKILERLQSLLIIDDSKEPLLPITDNRFRIQSIEFLGGINPSGPDQDEGVIERGISIALIYTVLS